MKRVVFLGLVLALALVAVVSPMTASAASRASLTVATTGLPGGQGPLIIVRGPRVHRVIRSTHAALRGLRPGRYVIAVKRVVVAEASSRVRGGCYGVYPWVASGAYSTLDSPAPCCSSGRNMFHRPSAFRRDPSDSSRRDL